VKDFFLPKMKVFDFFDMPLFISPEDICTSGTANYKSSLRTMRVNWLVHPQLQWIHYQLHYGFNQDSRFKNQTMAQVAVTGVYKNLMGPAYCH
jgi:hypothetical protein